MAKVMRQKQTNWPRLLILTAIFVSLCAGAQAQVVVEDVSENWDVGTSVVNVTGVNTSLGSNTALLVVVCLNNNDGQLPVSVTLDPTGTPVTVDWLDVGDQADSWSDADDGHCTIWG